MISRIRSFCAALVAFRFPNPLRSQGTAGNNLGNHRAAANSYRHQATAYRRPLAVAVWSQQLIDEYSHLRAQKHIRRRYRSTMISKDVGLSSGVNQALSAKTLNVSNRTPVPANREKTFAT